MVGPIRMLRAGAARIGGGDFSQRITITTGDELEALADQFNDMGGRLQESYADLERKVDLRTRELAQSVEELRALGEVTQAVNSTLDLAAVLSTIVAKAVQLSDTEAGAIYVYDEAKARFELRATRGMSEALIAAISDQIDRGDSTVGEAAARREPIQVADVAAEPRTKVLGIILDAGFRALLAVPLLGPDRIFGALVVRRRQPGLFPKATVDLLQTFAAQSVAAIQNARLFSEIEEKGRQLAVASQHKSQFLANMSHELRTPLNAVLGYTELMLDDIDGEVPSKMRGVLDRVQSNGRHLLGLINDVLDLSKIEAGQITLSLTSYSLGDVVRSVVTSVESLAAAKRLGLKLDVRPDLPVGRGDERRIAQVLLNLVGNAIKFTDRGEVAISAGAINGAFTIAVRDTGPGIPLAEQVKIFEEFHQADNSATKTKSGPASASRSPSASSRCMVGESGSSRAREQARPSRSACRLTLRPKWSGHETHTRGRGPGGQPADSPRPPHERRLRHDRGRERRGRNHVGAGRPAGPHLDGHPAADPRRLRGDAPYQG
jgi:signal transduction histidine kinase